MILEIFCVLVLCLPLVEELYLDRNGDAHTDGYSLLNRVVTVVISALCVAVINPKLGLWEDSGRSIALSFGIFTFFFPYLINIILYKRGVIGNHRWWSHLGTNGFPDTWSWWRSTPWYYRMFFLLIILLAGAIVYFCPCKQINYMYDCFC